MYPDMQDVHVVEEEHELHSVGQGPTGFGSTIQIVPLMIYPEEQV